ncbi:MAG: hypothetical protein JO315_14110 [Acidobacteria bacterium]|nr:hypothetical protein [Acidobacteriota bacterium]
MLQFIKKLLVFRLGQKSAKGAAHMLGLKRLGLVIGLIGGWRAVHRHQRHA